MINQLTIERAKKDIALTARRMLAGSVSFIEGSRKIISLQAAANIRENDPDFHAFLGISSETDALPLGEIRSLWNPEALVKLQPEIDRAEEWAKAFGTPCCQRLIDRFHEENSN
ncbi:MAG TPA: hypothetical protein VGF97_09410 [Rhizomicrobium sp.]|jgi:hypothetical protein